MKIKELRMMTGLSQVKFAELLDIPVKYISKWEQGEAAPPEYVFRLIKTVLWYKGIL